jgi:hypothetical protein
MASQKEVFNRALEDWIKFPSEHNKIFEQIDDVILLGVKI